MEEFIERKCDSGRLLLSFSLSLSLTRARSTDVPDTIDCLK